jgi:nicotinate-nucleotide adenylyltransferase
MPRPVSRIGLLGGSFDPVHTGHLKLAEVAMQHLQLDEIRWIPVGQPWQKARQLAPAADRLDMVRAAIAHEPRYVADDIELRRGGPSYTLDTVLALQAARPPQTSIEWWLIIGQDQCANFTSWQCWQELVARVKLAVACRGDAPVDVPLAVQPLATIEPLPMPPMAVSSTGIRQRLGAGDSPLVLAPDLLPAGVASYIADHHLYAPRGRATS